MLHSSVSVLVKFYHNLIGIMRVATKMTTIKQCFITEYLPFPLQLTIMIFLSILFHPEKIIIDHLYPREEINIHPQVEALGI